MRGEGGGVISGTTEHILKTLSLIECYTIQSNIGYNLF